MWIKRAEQCLNVRMEKNAWEEVKGPTHVSRAHEALV